jgi:hypothetical protein
MVMCFFHRHNVIPDKFFFGVKHTLLVDVGSGSWIAQYYEKPPMWCDLESKHINSASHFISFSALYSYIRGLSKIRMYLEYLDTFKFWQTCNILL